jgi:hypothetical protein
MEESYFIDESERQRRVDELLFADIEPVAKVRRIMRLGLDEDEATSLVSRQQSGQGVPVYYERLGD